MPSEDTLPPDAPAQDTSSAPDSAPADTQQAAAPESQDAQTDSAAPGTVQDTAPSTTTQQVQNPEPAQPQVDWQDRYKNLQSYHDRRFQQAQSQQQKLQEELQQLRQQQEQASLKPWSKQHPENAQFRGLLERSKAIHRQIQAADKLPPEQRQQTLEAIMAGVSPEEQQSLAQYRESMQSFQNDFFASPEETLLPLIQRGVQSAMQQVQEQMQAKQTIDRDFSAPHLQPILKDPQYASYLNDRLARGVPYEDAMEMLKLRAATDMMYRKLNGAERQSMHAQEQNRLVKGRAASTIQADPAAAPADPYALARKEAERQGIQPGTAAFNRLIDRFTAA
jgi:hypothetical protein